MIIVLSLILGPYIPYNVTVIASNSVGNSTAVSTLSFTQEGGQFNYNKSH